MVFCQLFDVRVNVLALAYAYPLTVQRLPQSLLYRVYALFLATRTADADGLLLPRLSIAAKHEPAGMQFAHTI